MTTQTSQVDYTEPPIVQGILSAVVAIAGIGVAAVSLIGMITPPIWLTGWLRLAPLAPAAIGWLLFIRFTRNDRNIVGRILGLELDIEDYKVAEEEYEELLGAKDTRIATLEGDVSHLEDLLDNPPKTLTITDRNGTRNVPMHERNQAWTDAVALVRTADKDHGRLLGADKRGVTQQAQAAALKVLRDANLAVERGTIYRLTTTKQKAIDTLNWLAQSPTPPIAEPHLNPDSTSYPEPDASGLIGVGEAS